ncbi:hypothetical protein [Azotobacter chroococcum]|uniref:hypothetical protein n=1 Tax=Azotobacter chroococcum TaxID=353 RepID=UPI001E30A13C|nr:hypothetical protein [Azotobacter chroococcum]
MHSPKLAHGQAADHAKPVLSYDGHCVQLRGDFLFHCHAEIHMMMGHGGLVRASQEIEATKELKACLGFELPIDDGSPCPDVDMPCMSHAGTWSTVPDLDLFVVHAAVLKTGKVLLWSGTAEAAIRHNPESGIPRQMRARTRPTPPTCSAVGMPGCRMGDCWSQAVRRLA